MNISKILVKIDRICDYIPVISTVTNFIDLFQKHAIFPFLNHSTIVKNRYYKHLNQKSFAQCLTLLVPGLNILVSFHYLYKKELKKMEIEKQKVNNQLLIRETQEAKEISDFYEETFSKIYLFIRNDPELKAKYEACLTQNRHLSDPEMGVSPLLNDPLVEEWSKQQHRQLYYEAWKLRFNDFMETHPDFLELFRQKYKHQNKLSIVNTMSAVSK